MTKTMKTTKILVQWIEVMPDGTPVIQTRKYNDVDKADAFVDKLPKRGITSCTKKISESIQFSDEILENQIRMDI